eukprot:gene994-1950_t
MYHSQNPFAEMLSKLLHTVQEWEDRVRTFLASPVVCRILYPDSSDVLSTDITPSQLDDEVQAFNEIARMYLELRVLKIKPILVNKLREKLWALSARTVLRRVVSEDEEENETRFDYRPTLAVIQKVLTGGRSLSMQSHPVYQQISLLLERCHRALKTAATTSTTLPTSAIVNEPSNVEDVVLELDKLKYWIDIESEYPFVRAKCLQLQLQLDKSIASKNINICSERSALISSEGYSDTVTTVDTTTVKMKDEIVEEDDEEREHCWCRQRDDSGEFFSRGEKYLYKWTCSFIEENIEDSRSITKQRKKRMKTSEAVQSDVLPEVVKYSGRLNCDGSHKYLGLGDVKWLIRLAHAPKEGEEGNPPFSNEHWVYNLINTGFQQSIGKNGTFGLNSYHGEELDAQDG